MMLTIVSLALRSPILGMHELGGCGVTGGYSIMFWYICNVDLGVALYWPLKESVSAGSGDGSVSLGAEFLAIWGEYGGSERQNSSILDVGTPGGSNDVCTIGIKGGSNGACTVGIKELEVVSGMNSSPSLETRNSLATLRSKRISDFRSGGGTADHLTGSLLTN